MGHCHVGSVVFDPGINNFGLTRLFRKEKIMEMECELLASNFRDPKTIAPVKGKIGRFFRWVFLPLRRCAKAWIEQGFRVSNVRR